MTVDAVENADTAPCSKCGSEIQAAADRCAECGYEPGTSILLRLAFWLFTVPLGGFVAFLAVGGTAGVVIGEITLTEWLGILLACAILGAAPGAVGFYYLSRRRRTAAE